MIVSFNYQIFKTQNPETQKTLANILIILLEDKHFIDKQSITYFFNDNNQYIFNDNEIAKNYLSKEEKREVKEYIINYRKEITKLHKAHLTQFTIGIEGSEILPEDAVKIIKNPSEIIVENGINDWKFIKGISQKYSSSKLARRSIYKLVNQAIKNEELRPRHAGGIGEFEKITNQLMEYKRYKNIHKYKLMALFDSDRQDYEGEPEPNIISNIAYFKQKEISSPQNNDYEYEPSKDLIIWHILFKRKIENYVPLDILFQHISSISKLQKDELAHKTPQELDVVEYTEYLGIGKTKIKEQLPELFLAQFSYKQLEQRCEHHKSFLPEANEILSEIEKLLLKIAKIV